MTYAYQLPAVGAAAETITADKWLPHYPDMVRRPQSAMPLGSFSYDFGIATTEAVSADKWQPHYPDQVRRAAGAFPQGCFAFGYVFTAPEVVTVDKWFNQLAYVPRRAARAFQQGNFTYPFGVVTAEVVLADKWYSQQQYVLSRRRSPVVSGAVTSFVLAPPGSSVGSIAVAQGVDTIAISGTATASTAQRRGKGYQLVPEVQGNETEHRRKLAIGVNLALTGKINAVSNLTLTPSASTTTITDQRITPTSFMHFMPQTANASAELGNGTIYVPQATMLKGSAVIQHANNAQTDRTFAIVILG